MAIPAIPPISGFPFLPFPPAFSAFYPRELSLLFGIMSILELKQQISRLAETEREELRQYLRRLQLESPSYRQQLAEQIRDMQHGAATDRELLPPSAHQRLPIANRLR